jgi:alkyl hydroperoxide reductase subunit F
LDKKMAKIEIFSKEWCPYCTKAKSLLKSKGLGYQERDVTSDAELEQEMIERSRRRSVPQIFIDEQSIGGYDDLALLNASGELDRMLGISAESHPERIYDVAIVGAGPAGMSAAIYASRKNLSTLVVSTDLGGQVSTTNEIGNYPGISSISGTDLVRSFEDHMNQYPVDKLLGETVTGISIDDHCKLLKTLSGREIRARSVVIATGAVKRKLHIPGEEELAGKGVVYCSTCDGPLFRNMTVAIIGGGNSGLEAAIEMNDLASHVYLVARGELRGDQILQDKLASAKRVTVLEHHDPIEIHGLERVEGLTVKNLMNDELDTLGVGGVFVEVGLFPNSDFLLELLETNAQGEVTIDSHGHTGANGIFAAGDVTDVHDKQIVIAAGAGANAALAAFEYLITRQ